MAWLMLNEIWLVSLAVAVIAVQLITIIGAPVLERFQYPPGQETNPRPAPGVRGVVAVKEFGELPDHVPKSVE